MEFEIETKYLIFPPKRCDFFCSLYFYSYPYLQNYFEKIILTNGLFESKRGEGVVWVVA